MKRVVQMAAAITSFCWVAGASAQTEVKPLWEAGAGFMAVDFPVYRGADQRKSYLLPFPYFTYRGEKLQINRERVRGLIFRKDKLEMDISVNGSVPAKGASVRQGMPDLDSTLEIGPSLNYHFYYSADRKANFDMRVPLRSVLASNFKHVQPVGWLLQPQLNLDVRDVSYSGWNLGLVGGVIYADRRYHEYFYDVAPQYATPTRPVYTTRGGYSGTQFILALSKRHEGYWTGGFMKWDSLRGAVFADSPLVKTRQYFTVGFVITWVLDKSDKLVEVNGD